MTLVTRENKLFISGDHTVVKQFPMFGKGEPLYLWADKGLIHWEYAKTNGYGAMDWREAAKRVLALSDMVGRSSDGSYLDERQRMQQFISDMERVIRTAKEQGGPNDKGAAEEYRRRKKKSVVVPRKIDAIDPFPEIF